MSTVFRVAAVQAEPEWLDLPACVTKTVNLMEKARQENADLIAFPECWIPGYPAWIWARPIDFELATRYIRNSLTYDSLEMETLCAAAAKHKINVVLGFSENDHGSLYIAQCLISADGEIKMPRRKLKPTHMERTIFGDCSGNSLHNVVDTNIGRVGALSCWEHINPLLKYHTLHQREDIHVAGWPPTYAHPGGKSLWSMSGDGTRNLSRTYAIESSAFVMHATSVLSQKGIDMMDLSSGVLMNTPGGGQTAIYGPDGRQMTEDIPETEEGIIYADVDRQRILETKCFVDACGHYSRPDLLWLGVDTREKKPVESEK